MPNEKAWEKKSKHYDPLIAHGIAPQTMTTTATTAAAAKHSYEYTLRCANAQ